MINYIIGDLTDQKENENQVIIHCVNNLGIMGSGVALALYTKWSKVKEKYLKWYNSKKDFELGSIQWVRVGELLWVVNLIGQNGIRGPNNLIPIRYTAIIEGFEKIKKDTDSHIHSIHLPRIGCGLAGGDWRVMEPIIEEVFKDYDVYIYDLGKDK